MRSRRVSLEVAGQPATSGGEFQTAAWARSIWSGGTGPPGPGTGDGVGVGAAKGVKKAWVAAHGPMVVGSDARTRQKKYVLDARSCVTSTLV